MENNKKKLKNGFTLIETIIYIALFSLIMTSTILSVYTLLGGDARNQTKAMVIEEGAFISGKIDWLLHRTKEVLVSEDGFTLSVTKDNSSLPSPLVISQSSKNLQIKRGSQPEQVLNNSNTEIICDPKCFIHHPSSKDNSLPESIEANFTINTRTSDGQIYSRKFSSINYLKP